MKIGDKTEGQILAEVIAAMVPGKSYRSRQLAEITGHGAASVQYVLRRAVARLVEVHHHMENRLNLCSLPAGARGTSAADGGTPSAPPRRELTFDTDWKAFRGGGRVDQVVRLGKVQTTPHSRCHAACAN